MRQILIILVATLLCESGFAQKFKLVDRSSSQAPSWINNLERGYIIATASNSDLEAVKQDVITGVKQQIAQSIVSNISVEFFHTSTTLENNLGSTYEAETIDIVRSTTDKIPFLQSISLSKVGEFYWEKHFDKKSGATRYDYFIKYPFSDRELDNLVAEFNAKQAKINATIDQMARQVSLFTQIDDIANNMSTLRAVVPELVSEDPRCGVIEELINRYRDQYKYIAIDAVEHKDNIVILQPVLSGRALCTSQVPTHKSNCADRITFRLVDGAVAMSYDDYVCRAGDDNWIDLTFKFGTNFVKSRIHIIK